MHIPLGVNPTVVYARLGHLDRDDRQWRQAALAFQTSLAWDPDHDALRLNLSIVESYLPPPSIVNLPPLTSNPPIPQVSSRQEEPYSLTTIEVPLQPQYRVRLGDLPVATLSSFNSEGPPHSSSRTLSKAAALGLRANDSATSVSGHSCEEPIGAVAFWDSGTPLWETGLGSVEEAVRK